MIEYEFGLTCDKAYNGQESLDNIIQMERLNDENPCLCMRKRSNYRLVFMDCSMPIMDGFEASRSIRQMSYLDHRYLYIVALTAYTDDSLKD